MINFGFGTYTIIGYEPDGCEVQLVGTVESGPDLPAECWNDAPIDLDRAHQATIDLCRGGK